MSHQITIQPSGHTLLAEDHETILAAALREGFMLPYGCRNGACGSCKGKVLSGDIDYGEFQSSALTDADIAAGKALFCVACATSDVTIECREVGAAKDIQIKTLPCRVHKLEKLGHDVMGMHLKLPANERMQFLAGQYIDILLKNGKRRSFSLANAPHDDALLQLHVRYVPGGEYTEHVFNAMKEKDILRIEGPLGSFFLREDNEKPIIFIAGGTGFAPIKAMVEHALYHHANREMVLYWGARQLHDLYMPHLASQWQQENPNFTFIPVLSQPAAEDAWPGRSGLVVDAVIQDFPNLSGYQVYACGAPGMVEAARNACIAHGLPEDEFFADAFLYQSDNATT
ncbi:CDP-6-deoxy-delta-3,4-glucoseen reductase [Sulfuriferula sp. AH1]|uniref:CDP-6-deoxy-delta-3,4-glucoseen reductase n=1 Tax=Sulfuriferula sp. AH1 TaxID=1985873 RepID=UPI000B3B3043|nr:CDP-6-deoxy-delta-3,4-glucoseen reductase [Sulfuriferula sp. AH1]ARU30515.1 CDP-6-deoxy-delta-3,4-glucoseen reductase [Sulfuriferula sp. AH1]